MSALEKSAEGLVVVVEPIDERRLQCRIHFIHSLVVVDVVLVIVEPIVLPRRMPTPFGPDTRTMYDPDTDVPYVVTTTMYFTPAWSV